MFPRDEAGLEVLVAGDAVLDRYLHGDAELCREGPVPRVAVRGRDEAPGAAANAAVNAATLGARTTLVTVVGDDAAGRRLTGLLGGRSVSAHALPAAGRATVVKTRVLAGDALVARFDEGSTGPLEAQTERWVADALRDLGGRADVVILSDYGGGVLTPFTLRALSGLDGTVIVADGRSPQRLRAVRPTAVTPSFDEALAVLGERRPPPGADRPGVLAARAEELLDACGTELACVTLDRDGAVVLQLGEPPRHVRATAVEVAWTAGAGDTFAATLGLALAAGESSERACELACAAAAVTVAKPGTASCTAAELRARVGEPAVPVPLRLASTV